MNDRTNTNVLSSVEFIIRNLAQDKMTWTALSSNIHKRTTKIACLGIDCKSQQIKQNHSTLKPLRTSEAALGRIARIRHTCQCIYLTIPREAGSTLSLWLMCLQCQMWATEQLTVTIGAFRIRQSRGSGADCRWCNWSWFWSWLASWRWWQIWSWFWWSDFTLHLLLSCSGYLLEQLAGDDDTSDHDAEHLTSQWQHVIFTKCLLTILLSHQFVTVNRSAVKISEKFSKFRHSAKANRTLESLQCCQWALPSA